MLFSAILLAPALLAPPELERVEAAEPVMGTLFRMTVYAGDLPAARRALEHAFARVRALDAALSDYKEDSELNRACRTAHQKPVPVSDDLFVLLEASQRLARATHGAFDVTQGPVIRLWRTARKEDRLPSESALRDAQARSGYRHLVLDPRRKTLFLKLPSMQLDLGGIAKGYAAEEALRILRQEGFPQSLVAAGGDLAIGAPPPGKAGWSVGLELLDTTGSFTRVVTLHDVSVSTSGDTEQFAEIGGIRYSHIIDPPTGRALSNRIAVTVIAKRGMDADALATALCVLGPARGLRFLERHTRAAALLATPQGRYPSRRFPQ